MKFSASTASRTLLVFVGFALLPFSLGAQETEQIEWTPEAIYQELSQPVTVQTKVGRDFSGLPIQVDANSIVLLAEVGQGSVEYTFNVDDIVNVRLPGGALRSYALDLIEGGSVDRGLDLLESLFQQREPFFRYLPPAEPTFFAEQIPLFRQHGAVERGLNLARTVLPYVNADPALVDLIGDEMLLGGFLLGKTDEARQRAQTWIEEKGREARSALGWYVLGTLQRDAEDLDTAWFTWLKPIVFSGARRPNYLTECYVGAIEVGIALQRFDEARGLLGEMDTRGLRWPADHPLPEFPSAEDASTDDAPSPTTTNTP